MSGLRLDRTFVQCRDPCAGRDRISRSRRTEGRREERPADERPEAVEIRGIYRATLEWQSSTACGFFTCSTCGGIVEGGVGDDPEEALLEV